MTTGGGEESREPAGRVALTFANALVHIFILCSMCPFHVSFRKDFASILSKVRI